MGLTSFASMAARCVLAAAALAAAIGLAMPRRPRRARRADAPAAPSREGPAELAKILGAAAGSSFARERAAAKVAELARDALALERGIDPYSARRELRGPALEGLPRLRAFIERDYLVADKARGRRRRGEGWPGFLAEAAEALDDIDTLRGARRGGRG